VDPSHAWIFVLQLAVQVENNISWIARGVDFSIWSYEAYHEHEAGVKSSNRSILSKKGNLNQILWSGKQCPGEKIYATIYRTIKLA
jgi:hypothetical protein